MERGRIRTVLAATLCLAIILACTSASAGHDPREKVRTNIDIGSGIAWLVHDAVNDELDQAGFTEVENPYLPFSMSVLLHHGRFAFGFGALVLFQLGQEAERDRMAGQVTGTSVALRLGYEAVALESFSVIPLVGVGFSIAEVAFYSRDERDFGEVIEQQDGGAYFQAAGLLLEAALRLEYRLAIKERPGSRLDLAIGLVGGFQYTPAVFGWTHSVHGEVAGAPDFGVTGPYVLATIGLALSRFFGD
jgi:hypothetical protein